MFEIVFFWVGLAIVIAVAARTRGRSGIVWALLSMLISPLLSGLLLLALPSRADQLGAEW